MKQQEVRGNSHAEQDRRQRAEKVVSTFGVKQHRFEPSGRELWTVIGSDIDFLVYPGAERGHDGRVQPYCSCDDYHFRVLGGQIPECYHLIALRRAREGGSYSKTDFSDEEYPGFVRGLVRDIFSRIS